MDLLTPDFGVFFWQSIILFVVLLILKKFAWKPALNMIKNRENFIEDALVKADECNKRAAVIEEECFEIVKGANVEKNKIIQGALDDRKKIISKAEVDAKNISNKIISDIEQSMREFQRQTVQNSKKDILSLSVSIAENLIGKELDNDSKNSGFLNLLLDEELKKTSKTTHHETV